MSELPPAIIDNPPFHRRPGIRRAVGAVLVVGACFAGWKLLKRAMRSDANKQLEARQELARTKIGGGLDALFEQQLDRDTTTVTFDGALLAPELGAGYNDHSDCARGFTDAFEDALGKDVVTFSSSSFEAESGPRLVVNATLKPSGRNFQLARSAKDYPGITMSGDIKFLGKTVHVDVEPGRDIEFSHMTFGIDLDGISDTEVAGGILQGTCKQAGFALLEAMTSWKRPPPPPPADPVAECERGFHCRENAAVLEESDPAKAAKLYWKACDTDDESACLRAADLDMALAGGSAMGEHAAQARVMLDMACARDLARTCTASGRIRMIPLEAGKPASAYQRREALEAYLRGCDLGDRDACSEAVPLVKDTPFAQAAPLLTNPRPIQSKTMGTIFALRWGQWTKLDSGQPTMWVTRAPARPPEGALVTELGRDQLPKAIVPPDGVETVYAIALARGMGELCGHCMPSGKGTGAFAMRAFDCVCALSP